MGATVHPPRESAVKAAVVPALNAPLEIRELDLPEPAAGQVRVRIEASGLCHTDIHAARGDWPVKPKTPLIPGHEGVGIVEEVDSSGVVSRVEVGVACGAGVAACTVEGAEVAAASDEVGCLVDDCAGVLTEIAVVFWVVVVDGACEGCCVDVAAPTGDGAEVGTVDDGAGSSLEGAEVVVGDGSDGAEGCWFEVVSSTSSGWAAMYSRRFSLA